MSSTVLGRNAVTVNKKYTEYFLPTVLTAMATNIAMIVDSIIAGNLLGQNSLAAINLMSPISQFYFSITILFGLGASSIISFAKGFLQAAGEAFTPLEKQTLPWGAKLMTMECGMRFLADYLEGDHYFHINYETQNLNRARTQFKLTSDMEKNWDAMQKIIEKYC